MWVFRFDLCGHQHVQSLLVSLALLLHCLGSTLGGCALSEPRQPWSGARDSGCGAGEAAREVTLLPGHCVLQPTRDHRVNKLSVGSLGGRGCARVCVCVCVWVSSKSCCCSVSRSVFRKCSSCLSRGWMFVLHAGMKYSLRDMIFRPVCAGGVSAVQTHLINIISQHRHWQALVYRQKKLM